MPSKFCLISAKHVIGHLPEGIKVQEIVIGQVQNIFIQFLFK